MKKKNQAPTAEELSEAGRVLNDPASTEEEKAKAGSILAKAEEKDDAESGSESSEPSRDDQGSKDAESEGPEWLEPDADHPANIRYVGKERVTDKETGERKDEKRLADRVPTWRRNGNREFNLPPGEIQLAGFWHRDAAFLLRAYRTEFKRPVEKGGE